jgi:hypothetical protein
LLCLRKNFRTEKLINADANDAIACLCKATELAQQPRSRVLSALAPAAGTGNADKTDDDPVPEDIDEFRYEVARRIRGFIEAHQAQQAEAEQKQDETPE